MKIRPGDNASSNLNNLKSFEDVFDVTSKEHLNAYLEVLKTQKWPKDYYNKYIKDLNEIERKYSGDTATTKIVLKYLNTMLKNQDRLKN